MKFSYTLLKQLVPQLTSKAHAMELLSAYSFEAEEAPGNTIEIKLPANRYADASSHVGVAHELSAALHVKHNTRGIASFPFSKKNIKPTKSPKKYSVTVKNESLCSRYMAQYVEGVKIGPSPKWMQEILIECGLRPINNVVDIMNYVMVETGQPLHAFDYDKLQGSKKPEIIIRNAKKGERITSIDGVEYVLSSEMLVIADVEKPLAIAGIKGGMGCEVTEHTKRILVEAAQFDAVSILKTSRKLGLSTDASQRFSHNLNAALAEQGISRATEALKKFAHGKTGERFDSLRKKPSKKILTFDVKKCNAFVGSSFTEKEARGLLARLGFLEIKKNTWEVPVLRNDIETHEDLIEEVVRMYGFSALPSTPPVASLISPEKNELVALKTLVHTLLKGMGCNEVYGHTFVSNEDIHQGYLWEGNAIKLENPVSAQYEYLRPLLAYNLRRNVDENFRYFDAVKIFEIGNVFSHDTKRTHEYTHLCVAIGEKSKNSFFELKGMMHSLLNSIGITDSYMKEVEEKQGMLLRQGLEIRSGNTRLGFVGFIENKVSIAEFNLNALLEVAEGDKEYEQIQKYPTVMRDISMFVNVDTRIGEVIQTIQESNRTLIEDVDLIDEYVDEKRSNVQSITLRIMLRAKDRTLTSEEVDKEMKSVRAMIQEKFQGELR